jgi:hypothetical protein
VLWTAIIPVVVAITLWANGKLSVPPAAGMVRAATHAASVVRSLIDRSRARLPWGRIAPAGRWPF